MAETDDQIAPENQINKSQILLLGAILGALTGLGAAYLLTQRVEGEEGVKISAGEGVKLGVSIFAFLRQVTQLGD